MQYDQQNSGRLQNKARRTLRKSKMRDYTITTPKVSQKPRKVAKTGIFRICSQSAVWITCEILKIFPIKTF